MSAEMFGLAGRKIVVCGGMSRVGRCIGAALVEAGACVVSLDIQVPFEAEGMPPDGPGTWSLYADITSKASIEAAMERVAGAWGVPDGLVNAAGVQPGIQDDPLLGSTFEVHRHATWGQAVGLALDGPMLSCQVIGSAMAAEGRGSIVNVANIFGVRSPDPRHYLESVGQAPRAYRPASLSAAHAGVIQLSRYLATYWAKSNVRVNALTFGCMHKEGDEAFRGAYEKRVALGRLANPQDLVGATIFLLSGASGYVTGTNLVVDGGWTAC